MKEYKLKINGNDYNVVINDVQESVASVEVNGSNYKVEFEKPIVKPTAIKVVRCIGCHTQALCGSRSYSRRHNRILTPSRCYPGCVREGRRHRKERSEDHGS